jgi:hypothetical protein
MDRIFFSCPADIRGPVPDIADIRDPVRNTADRAGKVTRNDPGLFLSL